MDETTHSCTAILLKESKQTKKVNFSIQISLLCRLGKIEQIQKTYEQGGTS